MQNIFFEWVVKCNDTEFFLSEVQHEALIAGQNERFIKFKDFTINPAFVSYSYKRPVEELKKRYPCKTCYSSGTMPDMSTCKDCKGSGALLPK